MQQAGRSLWHAASGGTMTERPAPGRFSLTSPVGWRSIWGPVRDGSRSRWQREALTSAATTFLLCTRSNRPAACAQGMDHPAVVLTGAVQDRLDDAPKLDLMIPARSYGVSTPGASSIAEQQVEPQGWLVLADVRPRPDVPNHRIAAAPRTDSMVGASTPLIDSAQASGADTCPHTSPTTVPFLHAARRHRPRHSGLLLRRGPGGPLTAVRNAAADVVAAGEISLCEHCETGHPPATQRTGPGASRHLDSDPRPA